MKLVILVALCAIAAAAPKTDIREEQLDQVFSLTLPAGTEVTPESRNILVNLLVRQLIAYLRRIINNGSAIFGIPPLDPLEINHLHLKLPTGFINIEMILDDVLVTGFGGFVDNGCTLNLRDMTFDIDLTFPSIYIRAGGYDLNGDIFNAIPLYGKGGAEFLAERFRLRALLHLKQSDDGESVLIDRIERPSFELPYFKSNLDGVIGGGDIDAIVNAIIEDVVIDYVNRFQGAIAALFSYGVIIVGNPVLDQLNTWRFLAPLIPRN